MENKDTLLEIMSRIKDANVNNKKMMIPTSDLIYKRLCSDLCEDENQMNSSLKLLQESHYIFIVKIVETDENLMISGVDGFVACEIPILTKIREKYARELELAYSSQFYERKQAAVIIRDLIGTVRKYNNTPLGNALNISVMVQQYEHFMSKNFSEFSDTWKDNKLTEILSGLGRGESTNEMFEHSVGDSHSASDQIDRAIDNALYNELEEMDVRGKWGQAVSKFGVEFMLRIHFRKFEFDKVKILINQKKVAREKDLKFIRDTMRIMENRTKKDSKLRTYMNQMLDLRRLAQLKLNTLYAAKKETNTAPKSPPPPPPPKEVEIKDNDTPLDI